MSTQSVLKPVTVTQIQSQKGKEKITVLTATDYPSAKICDQQGVDIILVGDSLAMTVYGHENTLSITLEDMLRHTQAVTRATKHSFVVGDMPFMSYQVSPEQAVTNAGRFLKESGAQAVKLEGGIEVLEQIRAITRAGIPVMAHIGLTPQSIHAMGGYRMHGKSNQERQYLLQSASRVQEAGAFSVVLECVEKGLAEEITRNLRIPTIGIGSGEGCDGQVLVFHDLVGLNLEHVPKFVKQEANVKEDMKKAVQLYIQRVKSQSNVVNNQDTTKDVSPGLVCVKLKESNQNVSGN